MATRTHGTQQVGTVTQSAAWPHPCIAQSPQWAKVWAGDCGRCSPCPSSQAGRCISLRCCRPGGRRRRQLGGGSSGQQFLLLPLPPPQIPGTHPVVGADASVPAAGAGAEVEGRGRQAAVIQAQHVGPTGCAILYVAQVRAISQLYMAAPGERVLALSAFMPLASPWQPSNHPCPWQSPAVQFLALMVEGDTANVSPQVSQPRGSGDVDAEEEATEHIPVGVTRGQRSPRLTSIRPISSPQVSLAGPLRPISIPDPAPELGIPSHPTPELQNSLFIALDPA